MLRFNYASSINDVRTFADFCDPLRPIRHILSHNCLLYLEKGAPNPLTPLQFLDKLFLDFEKLEGWAPNENKTLINFKSLGSKKCYII